jgi:hypothetical protein
MEGKDYHWEKINETEVLNRDDPYPDFENAIKIDFYIEKH